jgi:hypothetical protein
VNFLVAIELSSDFFFHIVQISTNYEKIILNSMSFSLLLLELVPFYIPVIREITPVKKCIKMYKFRMKSGMCKGFQYLIGIV